VPGTQSYGAHPRGDRPSRRTRPEQRVAGVVPAVGIAGVRRHVLEECIRGEFVVRRTVSRHGARECRVLAVRRRADQQQNQSGSQSAAGSAPFRGGTGDGVRQALRTLGQRGRISGRNAAW
jgi:hypothetical protein